MPPTARVTLNLSVADTQLVVKALRALRDADLERRRTAPVFDRDALAKEMEHARHLADAIEES